ncbi:hypothetical protein SKA58_12290 [Sphingomonas sp. SKA58]|nr:hypothetical protein SKA58_12290 [Sphingomonas sp. SKA58]
MLSRSGFRRDQFMHFALALHSNQIAASLGLCPKLHPEAGPLAAIKYVIVLIVCSQAQQSKD